MTSHKRKGESGSIKFFEDFTLYEEEDIKGIPDYIEKLKGYGDKFQDLGQNELPKHNLNCGIYVRGQSKDSYGLIPSIGRPYNYAGKQCPDGFEWWQERNMIHRFRRRSFKHYGRVLKGWEALFLAKHHELPTRILDWSTNPLLGLYWACQQPKDNKICDGAVWSFVRWPEEGHDLNVLDTEPFENFEYPKDIKGQFFKIEGIKIIYPFNISERITVQGGIFTIQDNPRKELQTYFDTQQERNPVCDIRQICKWKVPKEKKNDILIELNNLGINTQSVYPDIEGLSKGIWQIEVMRKGSST